MIMRKERLMGKWFEDNSLSIGNTPLVRINHLAAGLKATVLAKIEGRNPAYSVKCRIGASMVWQGEKDGLLKPGMEIIEPTSGNTGIALAYVAAARGYGITITMPETMSIERRKVLAIFGARLILTPGARGMRGAIEEAERIAGSDPRYFMPQQFKNPANPAIHFKTTGPEIWEQTGGAIDVLVSGVGTGGTITGISRFIKAEKKRRVVSVAVEPAESPVISQHLAGKEIKPGPHRIQGIGAGFIPDTLDLSVVDRVEPVTSDEAIEIARRLAREEGILAGVSCGAAMAAALRLARQKEFEGKTLVVILPDSGERYLSGPLFEGLFDETGVSKRK
jgi:cysteine synthase A